MPEGWTLIHSEDASQEPLGFDFEKELNANALKKVSLSTGDANPNYDDEQDGTSKKTGDWYRVRYVYETDNFLGNATGTTRDFCNDMLRANKLYRKEDIEEMEFMAVNPGWGPGGTDYYSIWLYKGGGNCHHFWLRQIYKSDDINTDIDDADIIQYTKARAEGFYPEQNDREVAIPPKRMANNGFIQ